MKKAALLLSLLVLAFSPAVQAATATTVTGTIKQVSISQVDWNNYSITSPVTLTIYMDGIAGACGFDPTLYARVALGKDNPLYESVVATVLTAKATNQPVELIFLDTCTVNPRAWDFAIISLKAP